MAEIQEHGRAEGDVFTAIGASPLVELTRVRRPAGIRLFAKLEDDDPAVQGALPQWSAIYASRVADADPGAGLVRYLFPDAGHTLAAPSDSPDTARARLERGWETLLGWVESGVAPGAILGVDGIMAGSVWPKRLRLLYIRAML